MKTFAWLAATVTLALAGCYTAISLARWEWNRALFFGVVFVAAEVGLAAGLILRRMASIERSVVAHPPAATAAASPREVLRRTRGDEPRFAWLRVDPGAAATRTNVFITLAVGGGVLLSGGAWLIDRIASRTVDPHREELLGRELEVISYRRGLVVDDVTLLGRSDLARHDPRVEAFLRPRP